VPTGPTSVTEVRNVRIDTVMYNPSFLKVLEIFVSQINDKIPNGTHPSDHVPVRVKFQLKAEHKMKRECAASWLECVTGEHRIIPMTDKELRDAFSFFDRDVDGRVTRHSLEETCLDLEVSLRPELQAMLLRCFQDEAITFSEFCDAYEFQLNESRLRGMGDLERAFNFFDADGDGQISVDELREAFTELVPIEFSTAEVDELYREMRADNGGLVDIDTFCRHMCSFKPGSKRGMRGRRGSSNKDLEQNMKKFRSRVQSLHFS